MFRSSRLAAFSDGVMSIAITLLVLGLEVPSPHDVPEQQLSAYLLETLHPLIGYVVSFVLILTYWLQHFAIFQYITRVDRTCVALNGLFLLFVSFVPFPTGLQASYRHDVLAMILYGATQAVCGLSLLGIWSYATKNRRLVDATISPVIVRAMGRRIALTPLISVVAIACTFVNLDLSRAVFLAIPVIYLSHRVVDRGWGEGESETAG